MSPSRRDDDPSTSRERTPEQRERDRLEREARRARSSGPATAPPSDQLPPSPDTDDRRQPPEPPSSRRGRAPGRLPDRPAAREPLDGAPRDRAAERRAARRTPPPAGGRDEPPLLRIQPDPPAPPAAPAGALGDEIERPIGIRRVRRAVAPRTPRAVVTPPGDVPAGPARARRSVGARVAALVALLVFAALIIGLLLLFQPFGSAEGSDVRVTIAQGASAGEIGDQLAEEGVVASGTLFSIRAALAGKRSDLRSGPHALRRDMSYGAAIDALTRKPAVSADATIDVTIPEGRSRRETARSVRRTGLEGDYLKASERFRGKLNPFRYGAPRGTRSLEGFLFPATYELKAGSPMRSLVDKQLAAFKENFASVDLRRAKRKQLTAYDVLIIASMVEREAQLASERPKIAAVIYNRLKDGVPLGIDATIRYALDNWTQPLKQSELQADTAFNTRKRAGLPPTPIGNPGLASIRAAAAPANVDFRYYVVKPGKCGTHAFSSTFEQFDRDRQRYDQARAAAGGKSPTTC